MSDKLCCACTMQQGRIGREPARRAWKTLDGETRVLEARSAVSRQHPHRVLLHNQHIDLDRCDAFDSIASDNDFRRQTSNNTCLVPTIRGFRIVCENHSGSWR